MEEWSRAILRIIDEIDGCIRSGDGEAVTLARLARRLGYSEFYVSRKFKEISGMQLRDYLRDRKLAHALREIRDTDGGLLGIALKYGYSSHEAFTRAFREAYGVTPSEYRHRPVPVVLRTMLRPLDCYLLDVAEGTGEVKTYFIKIPAHAFLHIRNYESVGYWDFWQKQSRIPGQDFETVCGLLDGIEGKLDGAGESGQVMAFINEPAGRICSWGIPLAEAYGVRLPAGYTGKVPPQMQLMDVPEGEYIVFEHGPFDYEKENSLVEARIESAMKAFDLAKTDYALDLTQGRVFYFYHDCRRFWKYVRPVRKRRPSADGAKGR